MRPARLRLTADGRFGGWRSRNCLDRSVAASGRTLALVRGGEFDPPPLIGAGTAALLSYSVALVYGSSAIYRARLIALATFRCSPDEMPVRLRE